MGTKTKEINILMSDISAQEELIRSLQEQVAEQRVAVAQLACPYKVGQTVWLDRGLGKDGLKIDKLVAPRSQSELNLWAIETFALTKAGEVSRRVVTVEQWQAKMDNLRTTS